MVSNTSVCIETALRCAQADEKCQQVLALGEPAQASADMADTAIRIDQPGIPAGVKLVHPRQLAQRGLGSQAGRIALLHAIAHIEFNAINLALDAAARFTGLPDTYYTDWLRVAQDEARHFQLLQSRLAELDATYGDLPAHNGLWDMALRTAHDPLHRMALVPRVMEARGLDVTPGMIHKLKLVGDTVSADILGIILDEEVAHVAIGNRWFHYCCQQRELDPETTWTTLVRDYFGTQVRNSDINLKARQAAGFSKAELNWLAQAQA